MSEPEGRGVVWSEGARDERQGKTMRSGARRGAVGACPIVAGYRGRDPMGAERPKRLADALTMLNVPHDLKV